MPYPRAAVALACLTVMTLAAPPAPAANPPAAAASSGGGELMHPNSATEGEAGGKVQKFQKATAAEAAAAIAAARKTGAEVANQLEMKFATIETPHFIVFTDWNAAEHQFLKDNVEGAYNAVSRQFEIPTTENVFIGKLPVFMFAKRDDFMKFVNKIDQIPDIPKGVAGYYRGSSDGTGHMVMWKPALDKIATAYETRDAERRWAYTLAHEFTHAFVARYRSNGFVPRWLNEGTAEVVAASLFPRADLSLIAKAMAEKYRSAQFVFDDKKFLPAEGYPIAQTMVQALAQEDGHKFLTFFNLIKDGTPGEDALKKIYGVDYQGLEKAWRRYVKTMK